MITFNPYPNQQLTLRFVDLTAMDVAQRDIHHIFKNVTAGNTNYQHSFITSFDFSCTYKSTK